MKNIVPIDYNLQLAKLMLKMSFFGSLASNVLGPLAIFYVIYDFLPHHISNIWLSIHVFIFLLRMVMGLKLLKILTENKNLITVFLYIFYTVLFFSALLNGIIIWFAVIYNLPDFEILIISSVILSLSAGALTTLSSLFIGYLIYLSVSMILLVLAVAYHGGDMFYIFAINTALFYVVFVIFGYKYYTTLRKAISLENTFKLVYENASDGVVIIKDNKFEDCNRSILNMFQFDTKEELINCKLTKLSPRYQPDKEISLFKMFRMTKKALQDGDCSFEWLHKRKNGEEFWCDIVLTKIQLEGKDLIHGAWRDISQKKELELFNIENKKELERRVEESVKQNIAKDRMLLHQSRLAQMGEMIGMIAHQWRQPLSAITSTSASISIKSDMGTLDKNNAQELSSNINLYAKHLSETIDDFRNFFKTNNEKEYIDYNKLLKGVLGIIEGSIKSKDIELIIDIRCTEEFYIYPNELKQVILNLVKNAEEILTDYEIESPYIKLFSHMDNDECIFEVIDNGGGVREDIMDKIFDPYFSTKLKKDGTGMGLYMSKIIVEEHCRGKLNAYNNKDGAVFQIRLKKGDY